MKILGSGHYVPKTIVSNDDLSKVVDTNDEWISSRTGISTRHISDGESVSDIASKAAILAIEDANINVNDIKNGMTILFEGNIYTVLEFSHVKPGKGAAFVQAKLKNLRTGSIIEKRFNSGVKLEKAMIEKVAMQYLYANGDSYNFMNMETYEQVEIDGSQIENDVKYLKEGN